jgi:hypothetical protein
MKPGQNQEDVEILLGELTAEVANTISILRALIRKHLSLIRSMMRSKFWIQLKSVMNLLQVHALSGFI